MDNKKTEKLTLLNQGETEYPRKPSQAKLETFINPAGENNYSVEFDTEEFTSLCPVTGQPDFARINIVYIPDKKCIESKSLKLYLFSYRNCKGFAEELINKIQDDLLSACNPRNIKVTGYFSIRGGIKITVSTEYKKKERKNK